MKPSSRKIRLTEQDINNIIAESVKKILKEEEMTQYNRNEMQALVHKMTASLAPNEKEIIYNWLYNKTWDVVYSLLNRLQQ